MPLKIPPTASPAKAAKTTKAPKPRKAAPERPAADPVRHTAPPLSQYQEYHDQFPRAEGPPHVPNGGGPAAMAFQPTFVSIEMDPGAYRAVWELVEATAMQRWPMRKSSPSAEAYVRAVKAFRDNRKKVLGELKEGA